MAGGTIILRPCGDITSDHMFKFPGDSSSLYELVSEEVCDENGTYIYTDEYPAYDKQFGRYEFNLSTGQQPTGKFIITGIRACANISTNQTTSRYHKLGLTINNINISTKASDLMSENAYLLYTDDLSDYESYNLLLNEINKYISDNGVLPDNIVGNIYLRAWDTGDSGKVTEDVLRVSQIYFEFDYKYLNIGLYRKKGGTYKAATNAYKKQNSTWSEIPEDEAKTILKNNTIRRG